MRKVQKWIKGCLAAACMGVLAFGMTACAEDAAVTESEVSTEEGSILPQGKSIYNLLLIGTDRRDESWNGNSDVMILATINAEKEKIVMTSFMRDLYADIPGYGVQKLNHAFAAEGAELLITTLENSYDLEIDNYMVVNFHQMASIVDSIGGVELTVSDAECTVMNQYLNSMGAGDSCLYQGGTYLMNGYQAVAYARNRYVGNCDYERTQRQRNVLHAIFDQMQDVDMTDMLALVMEILPEIEYDISLLDMAALTGALPKLVGYELVENRIPYDDLHYSQNGLLVPDFPATIERLHETIG